MIDITVLEIAGLGSALQALRLPFGKDVRSKVDFSYGETIEAKTPQCYSNVTITIDPKDLALLSSLVKRGDEHAKVLRGVMVWMSINAPRFWWVEADTYSIGAFRLSSESTMHIQGKGLSDEELVKMKSELPEGTMQRRVWCYSYQTLRRIYFQRRNHRLPHWRKFCEFIETLPFAKELILCQPEKK